MILIPFYGATGAAVGTLAAEAAVWLVQLYHLRTEVREAYKGIRYGALTGAVLAGVLVSIWVKYMKWSSFIVLVVSSVNFWGGYFIFLLIRRETMVVEILNRILKNKYIFFISSADKKK